MLKVSEEVMWRGEFEDVDLVHHGEALRFRFELDEDLVEDTTALNGAVVAACYWDYISNGAFEDELVKMLRKEHGCSKEVSEYVIEALEEGRLFGYDQLTSKMEEVGEFDALSSRCKEVFYVQ
jgi:hypothetical protein